MSRVRSVAKWAAAAGLVGVAAHEWMQRAHDEEMLKQDAAGRTCVVTGGASGVGKQLVLMLATKGWRVFAVDVNLAGLEEVRQEAAQAGHEVLAHRVDISNQEECEQFFEAVSRDAAVVRDGLDCLVNCAGVAFGVPALSATVKQIELQMQVNLLGPIRLCKLFQRLLAAGPRGGTIINVSSVAGTVCWPFQGIYSATKFGLEGFSDAIRREALASNLNLRVVLIKPGPINTPMIHTQIKQLPEWLAANGDDLFLSGMQMTVANHESLPLDSFLGGLAFVLPGDVARAICSAAVDTAPPARRVVATPLFKVMYLLLRALPTPLADRLVINL